MQEPTTKFVTDSVIGLSPGKKNNMNKLIGRYSNRNRLQVWFALIVFTICAWWNLHPLQFHLLDTTIFFSAAATEEFIRLFSPFHSIEGVSEIAILLMCVFVPTVLCIYFNKVGARYMASATFFWFAYAAQNGFRLFNGTIYRRPTLALIMFILSLLLLVIGLLKCLHNSEIADRGVFKGEIKETDPDNVEVSS
ncbi:MAG: hypothetical protein KKB51_11855 [Candidatus Riflebacteria bacterium]|nr:hypothetical protein [Candidatus Riflebacteria bacterium]